MEPHGRGNPSGKFGAGAYRRQRLKQAERRESQGAEGDYASFPDRQSEKLQKEEEAFYA